MDLRDYDKKHIALMTVQEKRINAIFNQFIRSISPELSKWKETKSDNLWVRSKGIEKFVDKKLIELRNTLENEIKTNQEYAWSNSNEKNDKLLKEFIKQIESYVKDISILNKQAMFNRNLEALKILQNRTESGLNLSDRVWNISQQTKGHIELYLQSGIANGRSAEGISRDLRQLLNDPNRRFRRIRGENGKLQLSEPMKNYHPGKGVYRSSRMNALRVAATETNMAYRQADIKRWQKFDFILGYEVNRSQNSEPCEICDALVGKYPKEVNFTSFHPFCKCYAAPIMMNVEDFAHYMVHDEMPKNKYIKDIPKRAKLFLLDNPKYYENSYFGKDNKTFFEGKKVFLDIEKMKK